MSRQQFEEYIAARAEAASEPAIDWGARRDEWLQRLEEFYGQVKGYVEPYVSSGKMCVNFTNKPMHEEHIGSYEARSLDMKMGQDTVRFDPVGAELIGARGRVDMVGPGGSVRFVLVREMLQDPQIEVRILREGETAPPANAPEVGGTIWKITTPPPRAICEELDEDSFFAAIMEILDA